MSGALPGGTRLPSKRQLAANLRVSRITVETAYGQLAAEGYIASAPRRGYFVQEQLAVPVSEPQEPFAPPLPPISASEETYPYDFRTDFVDNGCFPFSTWARLSRSVLSEYSSALLRATDPCGAAEASREEIVRYLHDFRGINVSPDNILIGAGFGVSDAPCHSAARPRPPVRAREPRLPQAVSDFRSERCDRASDTAGQARSAC